MRSEQCILNDMSIYQNIASMWIPCILVLPYFSSWSILIPSFNVGRPLKEVMTRVKKQYPSVQLSAWMVCVFLSEMILVFWVPLWTLPKSDWCAVLADSWLDKPAVHAFTIPSDLPKLCRMLLVMFFWPEHFTRTFSPDVPLAIPTSLVTLFCLCRGIFMNLRARAMSLKQA